MPTANHNNSFAKLTISSRELNDIRVLSIISPPRTDARIPGGHKPSTPLRLLTSASFRSNSPVVYVTEDEESTTYLQTHVPEADSSDDDSVTHEKNDNSFRKFLRNVLKFTAKFRSFKLSNFIGRS